MRFPYFSTCFLQRFTSENVGCVAFSYTIALFYVIFGLSLNFQRLLRCFAITFPLFAYKKIFYGTDLSHASIQFPLLTKYLLMGAVYALSSMVCFFSFFSRTMTYVVSSDLQYFPILKCSFVVNFRPVFLFGYSLAFAVYRTLLFVARRESVLIYQWYPASFRWVSINHCIYLMCIFSLLFVLFHKLYVGLLFFVLRIFVE